MSEYRFNIVTSEAEEVALDWLLVNHGDQLNDRAKWGRNIRYMQLENDIRGYKYAEYAEYTITDPILATEFALRFGEIIGVDLE